MLQLPEGSRGVGASRAPKSLLASMSLCMDGNRGPWCPELWSLLSPGPWSPPLAEGQEGSKVRGTGQGGGSVRETGSWLKPPFHIQLMV